ncbi:MAG TPA: hypothetical protein EYH50_02810 [Pyrodictium delaneyi]|uniref:Tyrosine specific protein phosphatases domain-containing protein n=1 Tax=Pyrodictium delaneyi TaxID=1273541 RepID=A0A832ZUJ8_9CREN|nr:hypothetical protein [Pyrodictium delaneyi]
MEFYRAPGLRVHWVEEGRIAVSPMPRPEDLESIVSTFGTVVSLATPVEHVYSGGYDPRTLEGNIKQLIWRPIGEYNAPTLAELAYIVSKIKEPALVHCFRGCGRSSTVAAAWLIKKRMKPALVAESEVVAATGCGVETLPQRTVLQAYSLAVRAGVADSLARWHDLDDPVPEYILLLSLELSQYLPAIPEELAIESLEQDTPIREAARVLADVADYTVASISSKGGRGSIELEITVWVPRRSHPAAMRRAARPDVDRLRNSVSSVLSRLGFHVDVVLNIKNPDQVPWV